MDAERFDALARVVASSASRRQVLGGLLGGCLIRLGLRVAAAQESPAPCASQDQLTQEAAEQLLDDAGIPWTSSGNCSDRTNRRCTSFEDIRQGTIDGIIAFQEDSGCDIVITGGTETGHADGNLSHGNGYKVDIGLTTCVDEYIEDNYEEIEPRSNGDRQWQSPEGDTYAREGNHWDITYVPKAGTGETRCGDGCCGACLRCEGGTCVAIPDCPADADSTCGECGPCETCNEATSECEWTCDPCQKCDAGACVPCDGCERCDESGACVVACDSSKCETCQATTTLLPSAQIEMACQSCGPGETCNEEIGLCEDEEADPCAPSATGIGQCR